MLYRWVLFFHIIGATVWTGGHLILASRILPQALRKKDPAILKAFEEKFEAIGIPALLIQVISGIWLAYYYVPDLALWFSFNGVITSHIFIKLILLLSTIILAIDARFRLIPRLSQKNLASMGWHIILVTILSVLFVLTGVSLRTAGIF
jgi:putative copper export protein